MHHRSHFTAPSHRTLLGAAGTLLLGLAVAGLPAPPPGPDAGPAHAQPAAGAPLALFALPAPPALPALPARLAPPAPPAPVAPRDRLAGDDAGKALKAALSEASSAKRAAQKLEGATREEALAAVIAQYAQIADNETFSAAGRAEAAFRAGDMLRLLKHLSDAEAQFHRAIELGQDAEAGREFAGRALLELAHMKRRASDVDGALVLYAEVGSRFADQRRSAAHAATWTGKLLLKSGEREKAASVLLGFAIAWPEYPAEAVRNADMVAVDQVEAGDEAGAQRTVETIRSAMEPVLAKGGQQAEAAQKALDAMRVTDMLAGYSP